MENITRVKEMSFQRKLVREREGWWAGVVRYIERDAEQIRQGQVVRGKLNCGWGSMSVGFPGGTDCKNSPVMQETQVQSQIS